MSFTLQVLVRDLSENLKKTKRLLLNEFTYKTPLHLTLAFRDIKKKSSH
jgi:hypothetical protein